MWRRQDDEASRKEANRGSMNMCMYDDSCIDSYLPTCLLHTCRCWMTWMYTPGWWGARGTIARPPHKESCYLHHHHHHHHPRPWSSRSTTKIHVRYVILPTYLHTYIHTYILPSYRNPTRIHPTYLPTYIQACDLSFVGPESVIRPYQERLYRNLGLW